MVALDRVVTLCAAATLATLATTAAAAPTASAASAPAVTDATRILARQASCNAVNLPIGGVLIIPGSDPVTLTVSAAFRPPCTVTNAPNIISPSTSSSASSSTNSYYSNDSSDGGSSNGTLSTVSAIDVDDTTTRTTDSEDAESDDDSAQLSDFRDPFYASTFPQCYALSATTVISYTLVIMLLITPRSFLDGGVVVLGRRGFTNGGSGGKSIGGRPWLQKVAALTVAISLTIATADTFRVAADQYSWGIQNAKQMQEEVLDGTELKVIRIISDTFLWLAQAQTLIRLFPRQREKVIIKWTAFLLVILDLIFDSVNSFRYGSTSHTFTEAIPALNYLFQLALGVLYAAWVIYYALMKKRYAFYHPKMRNICLVAMLSILAILVPIVFFILDISKPDLTAWGDYVRWVGAAAASVIVWEWVERIEALEREEKRDGILGREVFDGDEMLDIMPSDFSWPRRRRRTPEAVKDDAESSNSGYAHPQNAPAKDDRKPVWPAVARLSWPWPRRRNQKGQSDSRPSRGDRGDDGDDDDPGNNGDHSDGAVGSGTEGGAIPTQRLQPPLWPARPAPAVTPISRTDTASADSTIYVMRYHPVGESNTSHSMSVSEARPTSGSSEAAGSAPLSHILASPLSRSASDASSSSHGQGTKTTTSVAVSHSFGAPSSPKSLPAAAQASTGRWRTITKALPLHFHRGAASGLDDTEAGPSQRTPGTTTDTPAQDIPLEDAGRWDIRTRLEDFAATQAEKLRERIRPSIDTANLPVMVIPAPKRQVLARVLEEEESSNSSSNSNSNSNSTDRSSDNQRIHRDRYQASAAADQPRRIGGSASASTSLVVATSAVSSPFIHNAQPALWRSVSSGSGSSVGMSGSVSGSGSGSLYQVDIPEDGLPAVVVAALSRTNSSRDPTPGFRSAE